jgi:predicted DNA-binding transcriptional regulator AlpA
MHTQPRPGLVRIEEVARLIGRCKQRTYSLANNDPNFPQPAVRESTIRFWSVGELEKYKPPLRKKVYKVKSPPRPGLVRINEAAKIIGRSLDRTYVLARCDPNFPQPAAHNSTLRFWDVAELENYRPPLDARRMKRQCERASAT